MKSLLTLLIFFCNICFAQTKIEGRLPSLPNTQYSIITDQSALNEYAGIPIGRGKTDDTGQFSSIIDLKTEQTVNVYIDRVFFILWIKPNTTLIIQEGANGQYVFSGPMADENTVLYTTGIMQPYTVSNDIGKNKYEPRKQLHYLDSIETKRLATLHEAEKKGPLSKRFLSYCNAEISSFTFFNKSLYTDLLQGAKKITENDIPKDYFNFWENFRLQDDSTTSTSYQYALQKFIEYKTSKIIGESKMGTEDHWRESFRTENALLHDHPLTLQKQKTSSLLFLIKYVDFPTLAANEIENYKRQFPSSISIPLIDNLWQKKQASTSITPSFRLKNNEGKWIDMKDFKGKVVYIDFWGSWCKACLESMPHAEKLKEKLKGKDVVFLYLDFSDTSEKWINAIKKYKIEGIHLKAEKSDEEYFRNVFGIDQMGFPRYALVSKAGKLVTISAPAPQNQSAYDLIQKYLSE